MKEQYIQQVKKELAVSRKQKKEVVRDLSEAFLSALEHGETEQQVIERFGDPKEFADNIHEQLGIDYMQQRKRKKIVHITIAAVIAVMAFSISFLIKALRVPKNVIGQADIMTSIQVSGKGVDFAALFLILGVVAVLIAAVLIVRYIRKR